MGSGPISTRLGPWQSAARTTFNYPPRWSTSSPRGATRAEATGRPRSTGPAVCPRSRAGLGQLLECDHFVCNGHPRPAGIRRLGSVQQHEQLHNFPHRHPDAQQPLGGFADRFARQPYGRRAVEPRGEYRSVRRQRRRTDDFRADFAGSGTLSKSGNRDARARQQQRLWPVGRLGRHGD